MPIYDHECTNPECMNAWEDIYSMNTEPPKVCPKCNQETAKRIISRPGQGKVELTGHDLVKKLWAEGKALAKEARTNEKLAQDLYGK